MKTILFLLLALSSCASSTNKLIDKKEAAETNVHSRRDLQQEARSLIANDPNLDASQKARLTELSESMKSQLDKMNLQSLQLRSVLLKEVITPSYNRKLVGQLKARMRKLENDRLEVTFSGIDQANAILGRNFEHRESLRALFDERRSIDRE